MELGDIGAELVDDRSLVSTDDDQLDHRVFVDELEKLVRAVDPPTNVAIFAPWGSGKSSLCNLLGQRFKKDKKAEIRFVKFDAFKFAEKSLSRHFLSQIANQTDVEDKEFSSQLYEKTQTREVKTSKRFVAKAVGWIALAFFVALGTFVLAALGISWMNGDGGPSTSAVVSDWLKAFMQIWGPTITIIAIFVTAALQKFSATYEVSSPSEKEEFARRFDELARKIGTKKLVIFVDELDRCSPDEVVTTLETLKTFLDVEPCVFVVAADRQVLDHALHESARQATPSNHGNPYYSAGSAYIDKIFQYQMELPPLRQKSLVDFANELVADRKGVWEDLDDDARKYLLSVLIPSHVVNPRRAKVLVNSFTLTYRQLVLRAQGGRFGKHGRSLLGQRLTEIAKFVALRSEFPLFAAELSLDERLVQLVTTADESGGTIPDALRKRLPERVTDLAERFSKGELPSAELIVRASDTRTSEEGDGQTTDAAQLRKAQGRQLIAYLRKTRNIEGPRSDLIYLASVGADFSLTNADAQLLTEAARDADSGAVFQLLDRLEASERQEPARYLAWQIGDLTGIEQENAALTAIDMYGRFSDELKSVADQIIDQVEPLQLGTEREIAKQYLKSALILSRDSNRPYAIALQQGVVESEVFDESEDAISEALQQYPVLKAPVKRHVVAGFARLLWNDATREQENREPEAVGPIRAWLDLPPEHLEDVVVWLVVLFGSDFETYDLIDVDEGPVFAQIFESLSDAAHDADRDDLAERLLAGSLDVARKRDNRSSVDEMLQTLADRETIQHPSAIRAVLEALMLVPIASWVGPLESLDPEASGGVITAQPLGALLADLFRNRIHGSSDDDQVETILDAVEPLVQAGFLIEERPIRGVIEESTGGDLAGWEDRQSPADQLAAEFVRNGVLESEWVATNALTSCTVAIRDGEGTVDGGRLRAIAVDRLSELGEVATESSLQDIARSAACCEWMERGDSLVIELLVASTMKSRKMDFDAPSDTSEVISTAEDYGESFKVGIDLWIREFADDPESIWPLIEPIVPWVDQSTYDALRTFVARVDSDSNTVLRIVRPMLQSDAQLPLELFRAASLEKANQAGVIAELVRKAESVDSAEMATYILQLCDFRESLSTASGRRLATEIYPTLISRLQSQAVQSIVDVPGPLVSVPPGKREALKKELMAVAEPHLQSTIEAKLKEAWAPPPQPSKRSRNPLHRFTGGRDDD